MNLAASTILGPWTNFAVMIGSAAAALTGLMFVVVTLISGERRKRNPDGISTFSTPTVLHFSAALLVAAVLVAPWRVLWHPAFLLVIEGLAGLVYVLRITYRQTRMTEYTPDLEDRAWHAAFPLISYAAILTGAVLLYTKPGDALFAVGSGTVFLLFIGIHNAWDIVTYLATGAADEQD